MHFSHTEQTSIAWFKLAEFVGRKEKERALYLFRLLMHSLNDQALIAQLEGDLLAAFGDEKAIESYERAVRGYIATQRISHARMLYTAIAAHLVPALALQYERSIEAADTSEQPNQLTPPSANSEAACQQ
jgi:hypothetical protein